MNDIVERLRGMAADYRDLVARFPSVREVIDDDEIDTIADAAAEIQWLRTIRDRLAADLAKAHREALAWMQKANQQAGESRERESPAAREEHSHG